MLTVDPDKRPSARELLSDCFFTENKPLPCEPERLFSDIQAFPGFTTQLNEHSARSKSRAARGAPPNQGQPPQGNLPYMANFNANLRRAA